MNRTSISTDQEIALISLHVRILLSHIPTSRKQSLCIEAEWGNILVFGNVRKVLFLPVGVTPHHFLLSFLYLLPRKEFCRCHLFQTYAILILNNRHTHFDGMRKKTPIDLSVRTRSESRERLQDCLLKMKRNVSIRWLRQGVFCFSLKIY